MYVAALENLGKVLTNTFSSYINIAKIKTKMIDIRTKLSI